MLTAQHTLCLWLWLAHHVAALSAHVQVHAAAGLTRQFSGRGFSIAIQPLAQGALGSCVHTAALISAKLPCYIVFEPW